MITFQCLILRTEHDGPVTYRQDSVFRVLLHQVELDSAQLSRDHLDLYWAAVRRRARKVVSRTVQDCREFEIDEHVTMSAKPNTVQAHFDLK